MMLKALQLCFVLSLTSICAVTASPENDPHKAAQHSHTWLSPKSHPEEDVHDVPTVKWVNTQKPIKFALLCIHGLGLNKESFESFGNQLVKHGGAIYAIDVRGFGQWREIAGHSDIDFANTLADIQRTLQSIRQRHARVPVFLLGESMGGAIALRAAASCPDLVDGLISSVPGGDRYNQTATKLKVATHLLSGGEKKHDVGRHVIIQATDDQEMQEHWANDERNRMDFSANELVRFQKFMDENHEVIKGITSTPVLFVQGCNDRLVKSKSTFELFDEVGVKDKTLLSIPYEHLIFEEQEHADKKLNESTIRLLEVWLTAHSPASATLPQQAEQQDKVKSVEGTAVKNKAAQPPNKGYVPGQPVHFHTYRTQPVRKQPMRTAR